MRILAVDDEPSILELLTTFLESEDDNDIVTASSGKQALAIIETSEIQFDCILVDIQMPEMNGITLCENIRAVPGYFHVPIIMLTAMSQKSYIEKATIYSHDLKYSTLYFCNSCNTFKNIC